jgi:hypothetical protein
MAANWMHLADDSGVRTPGAGRDSGAHTGQASANDQHVVLQILWHL